MSPAGKKNITVEQGLDWFRAKKKRKKSSPKGCYFINLAPRAGLEPATCGLTEKSVV
jgi:hypothetical protein